jgi:hypothetical protein
MEDSVEGNSSRTIRVEYAYAANVILLDLLFQGAADPISLNMLQTKLLRWRGSWFNFYPAMVTINKESKKTHLDHLDEAMSPSDITAH